MQDRSQAHFITNEFCKRVGIICTRANATVGGLDKHLNNIYSKAQLTIGSQHNDFKASISCYVMHTITENMPNSPVQEASISIPSGIKLADSRFYE